MKAALAKSGADHDFYRGFIVGVAAVHDADGTICLPERATLTQQQAVVSKYLDDHPESLHEHVLLLTTIALVQAFPCAKRGM